MPRRIVILLAAATAAAGAAPAPATARERPQVCVAQALLHDTPNGLVVGVLVRGDRVRVLRRTKGRTWVRVSNAYEIRGWLRARTIC